LPIGRRSILTSDLTPNTRDARFAAERVQGEVIAGGNESVWGWTGEAGNARARRRADFLIEHARLGPSVRCLEVGAGTGEFSVRLSSSGCDLVALELSEATAKVCRERVGPGVEVVVGNIETGEGFSDQTYDAVVGVSVLHHVDLDACLEQVARVLRSGGRFAFSEPNMANPQIWLERHVDLVKRWRHVTPHETAFHRSELASAFEHRGLLVEVCEPFDFLHPATPPRLLDAISRLGEFLERTPMRHFAGSLRIAGRKP
jgi:SAM-dependent methyltransferase